MSSSRLDTVSPKLHQIAKLAKESPEMVLNTLSHHIDLDFLKEAYRRTRKDGAVGVDGKTAKEYGEALEENLQSLLNRFKDGSYKAPPVRRVHIPKGDGSKTRPIGIPGFEDKLLQRAVTMVLEAIYEQDFLDCSYGFRPGRSAHQAVQALWDGLTVMNGGWVLDVDLSSYFDTIDPKHLRSFLDQRVRDGVLRRTIDKWMKAGVMEEGQLFRPKLGTPQGGVVSPIISNIYLHKVLDEWFEKQVRPRLWGRAFLVRYADDFVIVCEYEHDARIVLDVLPKRLSRFGLTMHPEKTRLVDFRCPPQSGKGVSKRGTFDLLGFTHYWGKSRKNRWTVKRKTARNRLKRAVKSFSKLCRYMRHRPLSEQQEKLNRALKGHDAYYGITGNGKTLQELRRHVEKLWGKWLIRRSRKSRMNYEKFRLLLERYPLSKARVVHTVYGRQLPLPFYAANP